MPPILPKKTFQELTTDELYVLLWVRSEVFVVEQNCVYQDMDGDDQQSIHLWLTVGEKVWVIRNLHARRHPTYPDDLDERIKRPGFHRLLKGAPLSFRQ